MKRYDIAEVISLIRIAMDDNTQNLAGIALAGDLDYNELDELIKAKLLEVIELVHSSADVSMVKGMPATGSPTKNSDGSGWIALPSDFMRLVRFKMSGWDVAVTHPIYENQPQYILQKNRWARGNAQRPVCAIAGLKLEYYSLPTTVATHTISSFDYLPFPSVLPLYDGSGDEPVYLYDSIEIEELLYHEIVQKTAAAVLVATGDGERAANILKLTK